MNFVNDRTELDKNRKIERKIKSIDVVDVSASLRYISRISSSLSDFLIKTGNKYIRIRGFLSGFPPNRKLFEENFLKFVGNNDNV